MIDPNKTRNMKSLESMRKALIKFINFDRDTMIATYETDFNWGEEDYEADKERAQELLIRVERRIKSLAHYLSREKSLPSSKNKFQQIETY